MVACVAEWGHANAFPTTLKHAGLLGLGIEFVDVSYSFPQRGSKAQELIQRSAEFAWLLSASSGLGPLQPKVLRAYVGRVNSGPRPLDAVRAFIRVAHAEEEQRELAAARVGSILRHGPLRSSNLAHLDIDILPHFASIGLPAL